MLFAVTHQALGRLFWRHDPHVGDETAVERARIVEINGLADEIRAIAEQEIEATLVGAGVECLNEGVVLLLSGFDPKSIDGPVVCGAYQLGPISLGRAAVVCIRRHLREICSPIGVPQHGNVFQTYRQRNPLRLIYGVQVRQYRNRDPIEFGDAVITADHDALLALVASP